MSPFVNSVSLSCLACQLCLGWWLASLTRIPIVAGGHVIDAVPDGVAQCRWGRSMPSIPNIITSITLYRRTVPPNVHGIMQQLVAGSSVIGQPSQRPSSLRPSTMRVPWYETKQEDIIRSVERSLQACCYEASLATLLPAHLPFSGTILNEWLSNVITVASMFRLVPALNLVEALSNRIQMGLSHQICVSIHIGLIGLTTSVFLRGSPS